MVFDLSFCINTLCNLIVTHVPLFTKPRNTFFDIVSELETSIISTALFKVFSFLKNQNNLYSMIFIYSVSGTVSRYELALLDIYICERNTSELKC